MAPKVLLPGGREQLARADRHMPKASARRRIRAIAGSVLRSNFAAQPVGAVSLGTATTAQPKVAERRIASGKLHAAICSVLDRCGADAGVQETVATHLVEANLRGHDSHGIQMISKYIKAFQNGNLDPNARMKIVKDDGLVLVVDGGQDPTRSGKIGGFGQVIAREATLAAIEKAEAHGLCLLGMRNANHIGRVGTYAEMCSDAGFVCIQFANATGHAPLVASFGGIEAKMGTNPVTISVPTPNDAADITLDFATSVVASGKVVVKANRREQLAPGHLIDPQGNSTSDPEPFARRREGALLPFGLHKGSGLSVMCELLGGTLTGGGTMESFPQDRMAAVNNYLAIILDPALFRTEEQEVDAGLPAPSDVNNTAQQQDLSNVPTAALEAELAARKREQSGQSAAARAAAREIFRQEAQVLADWVTSSSPAAPIDYESTPGALPPVVPDMAPKVLLPGGREQLARADRLEHGVLVDDGMWEEVLSAGEMLSLSRSELNAIVE